MRWRILRPAESGISLVAVLVAVAIAGIVATAIFQMLTNSMNTQRHMEYKDELRQVRNLIAERISCASTLTNSVLNGCLGAADASGLLANGPYITLRDKKGNPFGKQQTDGSMAMGRWHVRAKCVKSAALNTIQLATARFDKNGNIMKDPLSKKPLGWMPVYTEDMPLGTSLCTEEITGGGSGPIEAPHLEQTVMEGVGGTDGGCGSGLLEQLFQGQSRMFRGTVVCPEGKIAVSGGAECMPGAGRPQNIWQAIVGMPKGLMIASRPSNDGQGWSVECCLKSGGFLTYGGSFPAPAAYAVCLDEELIMKKKNN